MVIDKLIKNIEEWAPPGVARDRDNVGLLVGSGDNEIKNVFLCLELNEQALKEAVRKNCNFIFTHHPLIFNPIKKLNFHKDSKAALIEKLIKNNITLYSAHTNLDHSTEGVSFSLAGILKLQNIKLLSRLESNQFKLVTFVPEKNIDEISQAVFNAGGGVIGEYSGCSFRLNGEGTFKGSAKSNPVIGNKNVAEKVNETRLEFVVGSWNLSKAINALLKVHPYEEPAYDVYPLKNAAVNYGEGAIGTLKKEMSADEFIKFTCKCLNAQGVRYTNGKKKKIYTVAVCGGAGYDQIENAISAGADAFITADLKYHTFQDAENKILLIDAGHYETEVPSLTTVKEKFEEFFAASKEKIKVNLFSGSTNPVKFYKHKES
jgi:dinuclear metal center YbgI/SA1388 family protein